MLDAKYHTHAALEGTEPDIEDLATYRELWWSVDSDDKIGENESLSPQQMQAAKKLSHKICEESEGKKASVVCLIGELRYAQDPMLSSIDDLESRIELIDTEIRKIAAGFDDLEEKFMDNLYKNSGINEKECPMQ